MLRNFRTIVIRKVLKRQFYLRMVLSVHHIRSKVHPKLINDFALFTTKSNFHFISSRRQKMLGDCHSNYRNATVDKYRFQGNTSFIFVRPSSSALIPFVRFYSTRRHRSLPYGNVKSGKYSHRHSIDSFIQQCNNIDVFMASSERFTVSFVCVIVFVMRFLSACRSSWFERKL